MLNTNIEALNTKQIINSNAQNTKLYDLEERTLKFAKSIRLFVKKLLMTIGNQEDCKQLIRSSGSIGANYIEANEALSKRDFSMRVKISRKEAKETIYWLKLIDTKENSQLEMEKNELISEVTQLMKIFGSIIEKTK